VTDTGIGIPLDKQQAIFDHFSQVDSTISRRFGGTGLGLSICRQLVHLMEGKIWVESDVGKGSVFFFTLKLMPGNPAKVRETGRASCGATGRSLQILVAEDNPVNVEIALHFLSQMGHRVRVAENGRDAIDALRAEPCDLVLMDVEMPVLDGFEATRKIRSGEAGDDRRKVPIIAMTAHAVSGFREQCLNVGMDDYLTKPVEPEKLADAVRRIAMEAGAPPPVVNVGISDVYVEANRPSVATLGDEQDAVLHLDLKKAMKLYNDNESLIRILCSVFLQEAPGIVEKMKDAIVAEDLETVRLNAHSLKSSSAAIGAGICSSLSARLEQSAKKRDALAVGNEFHELAAEFAIVKTLLQSREGIQAC
jgi:CheY-like chemotaxis protein/HPt (histidine-containing phosphotransfer) domain-containing protein